MFQTEKKENQNKYLGPTQNRTAICRIRICCANHYTMGPFGPFVWVFPDEQGVQIDYASFHESWPHVSIEFGRNFVCHTSIARVINRRFTPCNVQSAQIPGNTPLSLYSIRSSEMLENTLSVGRDPAHAPLPTERRLLETGERTTLWSTESFCDPASRSTGASSRPNLLRSSTPKGLSADRQESWVTEPTLLQAK